MERTSFDPPILFANGSGTGRRRAEFISTLTRSLLVAAGLALSACGGGDGGSGQPGDPSGGPSSPVGTLRFSGTDSTIVGEAAGTATVMISRVSGSRGAVSVVVTSTDGTATAGQDYTALNSAVRFADGDSSPKAVRLAISNDTAGESAETVVLTLSNPTGGATLASAPEITSTITIQDDDAPAAAGLAIGYEVKRLAFAWNSAVRATSYKFLRRESPTSDFVQVGADLASSVTSTKITIPVHLYSWVGTASQYRVDSCNPGGCTPSNIIAVNRVGSALAAGYMKASDTGTGAGFGSAVAVSGDGKTVAIGAPFATAEAGSVYVYTAPVTGPVLFPLPFKIPAPSAQAMHFGFAVALSEDGNTLAVGAPFDDHAQSGVGTYPIAPSSDSPHSGGVFVYSRVNGAWSTAPIYIKASDVDAGDEFGSAVALKGAILVVGAPRQDSPTNGVETTNSAVDSGAAYAFYSSGGTWAQSPAILKASNIGNGDLFGTSVALSTVGSIIVVGAPNEDGDAKLDSGAAYRFVEIEGNVGDVPSWNVAQRFKATNSGAGDLYGSSVAVSANGQVLVVGAPGEDGTRSDNPNDNGNDVGAVYAYTATEIGIPDAAYLKATHPFDGARYGSSVAINGDGTILAAGSPTESVNEIGTDGSVAAPAAAPGSGAVDVLVRQVGASWSSQGSAAPGRHYIKANNTGAGDIFGSAVSLSEDGGTLVVGASGEDGNGRNIDANNNPANNTLVDSGAAYVF